MSLTNQDIDISMDNVVQYANQIRMPLDSWNKETQKTDIVCNGSLENSVRAKCYDILQHASRLYMLL